MLTHDTNPKIKNKNAKIIIDMIVVRLVVTCVLGVSMKFRFTFYSKILFSLNLFLNAKIEYVNTRKCVNNEKRYSKNVTLYYYADFSFGIHAAIPLLFS